MLRLDYIRVPGHEWIEDPERRFDTVDMRDPIVRLIRRGEAAILDDLPKQFHLPPGELQRRDLPRIPERVIREAVVNALMHRSYRKQGPTQIIRYANRIEIRNPGHSLKAEDRLGEPGSETRNPSIAAVLHETDFAETKGSGIRVMRQLMRDMELAPPTFHSDRSADEFVATLFLHNFLDAEDLDWLSTFADLDLSTDEKRALVHVREAGRITNADYRDLGGVDTLEASSRLRHLRDLGLLEQHDRGSATFYTATERLQEASSAWGGKASGAREKGANRPEQSPRLSKKTPKLAGKTPKLAGESPKLSEESPESRMGGIVTGLPPDLAEEVASLNQWTPQPAMRRLVVRLCAWKPMTAQELAALVGRRLDYFRKAYIRPMVRSGDLHYTNPEKPSDPTQRYRASGEE